MSEHVMRRARPWRSDGVDVRTCRGNNPGRGTQYRVVPASGITQVDPAQGRTLAVRVAVHFDVGTRHHVHPSIAGGIAMSTLERAIEIAAAAHAGQVDKAGQPYILHPLRVMLRVATDYERMAAVLHDVVEDTPVTLAQLTEAGFPKEVVDAIEALTKRAGETRMQAAARAASNPIARVVKLADNAENMDLSRIANPTEKDFARVEEYKQVRALLLDSDSN